MGLQILSPQPVAEQPIRAPPGVSAAASDAAVLAAVEQKTVSIPPANDSWRLVSMNAARLIFFYNIDCRLVAALATLRLRFDSREYTNKLSTDTRGRLSTW